MAPFAILGLAKRDPKGYPGEGPTGGSRQKVRRLLTTNGAGVHALAKERLNEVQEARENLIYDFTDKLWELVNVFKSQRAVVMAVSDTRNDRTEADAIRSLLRDQGIEMAYSEGIVNAETGRTIAGVQLWWDPREVDIGHEGDEARTPKVETVVGGRRW